jgi:hypothetical protein
MTADEHVKMIIGGLVFDIAVLNTKLEEANALARESGEAIKALRQGAQATESAQ